MLKDAKGNQLYRKVVVRVVFPDKIFKDQKITQHAPAHKGFSEDSIDEILMNIVDRLDQLHPYWEFKETRLASEGRTARICISFAGYRKDVIERMKKEQAEAAAKAAAEPVMAEIAQDAASSALAEATATGDGE